MKILIVEDEPDLRDSIGAYFTGDTLCETTSDYLSAYAKVSMYRYDCIILDLTLPQGNGLDIVRHLRENRFNDGVLIISARNSLNDRVTGLDLGADDYLTKPFHLSELRSRVSAIVRRRSFDGSNLLRLAELTINLDAKEVAVNDQPVKLTRKEYALLLYFIANKGKVVPKSAIAEHLWGDSIDIADNFDFIYSHIKNIRKKLLEAGGKDRIQAAYGMGYKFTDK